MSKRHKQGIPLKNIPSAEKCRAEGWVAGQYLVAPNWSTPREIKEVRELDVMLDHYSKNRVKSFHPEVRLASNQEAAKWQAERKIFLAERGKRARKALLKKVFVVRVIEQSTGTCIEEVDCGDKSRKQAERVELGMLRNMDLERFSTQLVEREAS